MLAQIGLNFDVVVSETPEILGNFNEAGEAAVELAKAKAEAVSKIHSKSIIIAADTIVSYGSIMLGKPIDHSDAVRMLRMLSGHEHIVTTGVAVIAPFMERSCFTVARTKVEFRDLSDLEIQRYVASGEPMDKAGAYAIQGYGASFVRSICGCYSNVVGLPLSALCSLLVQFGIDVSKNWVPQEN